MNVTLAPRLLRLQQSLHSGGSQHVSNLNVCLEYIWVKKSAGAMPTLYGEVSSIQGLSNILAINRINILTAHILCYNKHVTFYAEENAFSILFYGRDDSNGRIFLETLNMDHSPRIEKMC